MNNKRIRLLLVAADVGGLPRVDVAGELRAIERELALSPVRHAMDLRVLLAPTLADLHRALLAHRPHVLHVSGHGDINGLWLRADETVNAQGVNVPAATLAELLLPYREHLRLVVLNLCDSEPMARTVAEQLSCAIGFNAAVGDEMAHDFAITLYRTLAAGQSIQQAFDAARTVMAVRDSAQAETLRLHCSDEVDAQRMTLFSGRRPTGPSGQRSTGRQRSSGENPTTHELRHALEQGELVIVAGSGIRVAAGLPSWRELVQRVFDHAAAMTGRCTSRTAIHGREAARFEDITSLIREHRLTDALAELSHVMGEVEFGHAVERLLDDSAVEIPEVAECIAALAPSLRAVLTTNLDRIVDRAFAGQWPVVPRATGDMAQREHVVIKLHGTLEQRNTWVLTDEHYRLAQYRDTRPGELLRAFFRSRVLLFVGYEVNDPDLRHLLGSLGRADDGQPPRHHALIPAKRMTPAHRRRLRRCGIHVETYANDDGYHGEVVERLCSLATP